MIEISLAKNNSGVFQKDIAVNQNLSLKYLDHIIHALKTARLITNAKGHKSGYVLTRDPGEISIFDIHRAFEPDICLVDCVSDNYRCDFMEKCQAQGFWHNLNDIVINYFKSVTLKDLQENKIKAGSVF